MSTVPERNEVERLRRSIFLSTLQPASQQSQDLAKLQQAQFFAQNKSGPDSKEVWIVVMRPEGEQENKTAASPVEAKTTPAKSLPDKNKGKVSGKNEQTAPPPNLPVTVPGAGVTIRRLGASKENVFTAHSNTNPLINLALPADRSGARVSSTPTSGSLFASLMAPSMQDLQVTGQNSVGVRPEVGALASNAASQFTGPAVICSSSMLTRLLTTNLQDLQGPMATSTPVQRKRPAVMATEAKSTPSAAKTSRQVCARKSMSNLPSDMPVLTFDNLNSCNLPSSRVSRQGAFNFNSSSVSASVPLDHSSTIAASSSTHAYPVLTFLSQPFSTSTPVLHRSPATESPKLHHFRSLSTEWSSTNPTWTPTFGVATPSFGVATPRRSFREQMSDSGIGASVGSLALTPVRMEGGLESDAGATCSSWAASDDSNHMTVDLTVDNLSQGSVEENSNSQESVIR
ncbi:uncharacterized protein [Littorina saxatilis]|uniref:uncharacterized protein n=1 Tax=Littorina saxatilis TaxID=31220 RepID=UPI0038B466C8